MIDPEMWDRCRSYPMPSGPEGQAFSTWLSEEENIAKSRADELVLEYRRYLYLAASGAAKTPVAPGQIGKVNALHRGSGDFPRFCQQVLGDTSWPEAGRADRHSLGAMTAAYEAEFGRAPNPRIWRTESRTVLWIVAMLLLVAGSVGALIDGSLALLALGVIPAALLVLYILTAGKMAGADGLSDAARYGGGSGGGGLN